MGRIRVLDEQLSNMIAAGEVVERPASVVKELIENAIDAHATRIEVHIEEGGLALIRIQDDGIGMDRDDCVRSFERHATSKIKTTRDLFQIQTLGFRGEAMPSIASVSRMELTSTEDSGKVGTRLVIEAGQVKDIADATGVKGTQIIVRDLFFNTPARLKYMKSIATEVGHISDYVNRLALTYPSISFHFAHNGKTILQTSGDGKLLHVLAAIYGVQAAKLMIPVEGETLDFRWTGYLSKTELTRANRTYMTTLVNGRYIRNFSLSGAILRGYHTLLPIGRFPVVCLAIEMDPTLVDVNVHPAKLEVRFSKEDELMAALEQSVRSALRKGLTIPQPLSTQRKGTQQQPKVMQPSFELQPKREREENVRYPMTERNEARVREWLPKEESVLLPRESSSVLRVKEEPVPVPETEVKPSVPVEEAPIQENIALVPTTDSDTSTAPDAPVLQESTPVPPLFPVGQVHGTYIIAQNETGMYIIDQHAAQERIFYEYFMEKLKSESVASQLLLFPHTVECTAQEEAKLKGRLEILLSLGLEIEWFGNRTFLVRAHPHWFPEGTELDVIDELVQFVLEARDGAAFEIRSMREKAAIMMSCKASIKANRFLTQQEMEALLERLRTTTSPFTCPHGRPIIIHFSSYELEKLFKRVM